MKFCNTEVESRFFLAPMAGVTDPPFRTVCEEYGAALTYTEMVSAKALTYKDQKSASMLALPQKRKPCFVQIFGSEPDVMAEGARLALEISGAEGVDINMGCPVHKIVGNGEGSALMRDPKKAEAIIKAVKAAVEVPVTVKFRRGFEAGSFTCVDFAKMAEQAGVSALAVHGRTRSQMYSGESDRNAISEVKKAVSVPVIASGDALSGQKCLDILSETGADYVMIARGAEGNPFIFEDCLNLEGGRPIRQRHAGEIIDTIMHHAELMCGYKGEMKAMLEFRKHGLLYLGLFSGVKPFKLRMAEIKDMEELGSLCEEIRAAAPVVKEV